MNLPKKCDFCGKPLTATDQVGVLDEQSLKKVDEKGVLEAVGSPSLRLPDGQLRYVGCIECLPPHVVQQALEG